MNGYGDIFQSDDGVPFAFGVSTTGILMKKLNCIPGRLQLHLGSFSVFPCIAFSFKLLKSLLFKDFILIIYISILQVAKSDAH